MSSNALPPRSPGISPARLTASETLKLPRWGLIVLCLLYILPGLVGRDPWKSEDAMGFGVMYTMSKGTAADWLLPNIDGAPVLDSGPLMYWVGAASIRLLGWAVDADLAARFATVIFFFVAVTGIWYATYLVGRRPAAQPARLAFGGHPDPVDYGRVLADGAMLILLATIGLVVRAHESSSDVAMLGMLALALYGMARALDAPSRGAVSLALAVVGLVYSRGPAPALAIVALWIVLIAFHAEFKGARRATATVFAPIAIVGLAIWPLLAVIVLPDPALHVGARLDHWRQYFDGIDAQAFTKYVRTLPWTTWIAWPVAAWSVWTWRHRLGAAHIALPGGFVIAMLGVLASTSDTSDGQLLLVLPGLVMVAALGLPTLRRGAANAFDWFSLLLYSLAALFVWFSFFTKMTGIPAGFARSIARLQPGAVPEFRPLVFLLAVLATMAWFWIVYWRVKWQPKVLWRSVVLASGGLILVWTLVSTLFLHSIDYSRTYRDVAGELAEALRNPKPLPGRGKRPTPARPVDPAYANAPGGSCVATDGVGLAQRASFNWFAGIHFSRVDYAGNNVDECEFLLRQDLARNKRADDLPAGRWQLLWEGRRPADRDERFRLYRKLGSTSTKGAGDAVDRDENRPVPPPAPAASPTDTTRTP